MTQRSEQTTIQDAVVEAKLRASSADYIQVPSSHRVMTDMTSVMRKKLKPYGLKDKTEIAAEEGVDLFGLVGAFWNTSQAQLTGGNPRGVGLSVREISYIANLFEPPDITPREAESLIAFRSIAVKALDRAWKSQ